MHLAQDHSHVEVVSFPRDMLVSVPECPDPADSTNTLPALYEAPLNTVLKFGGLACVALTIEQLTGVQIPVGGVVEFKGVAALAEAVGGVEVCLADPVDDDSSGLHLAAGKHVITGYTALAFLRTRHGVGDGSDLARIASQQTFLASLARTMRSSGTLGDPVKLYSIAKVILSNMQLSNALQNPVTLVSVARALQAVDLSRITFVQYPTEYTYDFRYVVPSASAEAVNVALQQDLPLDVDPDATTQASFGTVPDTSAPPAPTSTRPGRAGREGARCRGIRHSDTHAIADRAAGDRAARRRHRAHRRRGALRHREPRLIALQGSLRRGWKAVGNARRIESVPACMMIALG